MAGGVKSLLAPWIGGVSSPPGGGYRSLLAFWAGGTYGDVVPTPAGGLLFVDGKVYFHKIDYIKNGTKLELLDGTLLFVLSKFNYIK